MRQEEELIHLCQIHPETYFSIITATYFLSGTQVVNKPVGLVNAGTFIDEIISATTILHKVQSGNTFTNF